MWRWADMSGTRGGDERKVSSLRELSRPSEPARDLWPQIEARISEERSMAPGAMGAQPRPVRARAVPLRWLAAAAVVASVAGGVWVGRRLLPAAPPRGGGGGRGGGGAPTALDVAYVSDPRYQRDRAALMQSLQARLAALPPPARAKVMASLAAIHRAKQDLENALGKDPGNALLQELLVNTYQDEMRVLTDVHEAGAAGRGICTCGGFPGWRQRYPCCVRARPPAPQAIKSSSARCRRRLAAWWTFPTS